ncbi:MAG: acetyl-CoA acetyltransferase [Actinomycetia bacterium]|nr:acetyl-CoA acetyltransferase [Actinomycetes bacterium]MCP4223062.1 acetyl-CoA acetyltransferase [Actinomycetes bacterium]MCP5034926.1 acetyl-CoA acetyltransferase [Actinomycetes bacterium]
MTERTLRGRAAVVGVAETDYYRWGRSPDAEFKMAIEAVLKVCADAGISPSEVDGFSSYSNDRSDASRLSAAIGADELRFASMQWGGGGGGGSGALANASAAIATGQAECVVVFRALAQGQFGRFGQGPQRNTISGHPAHTIPYGLMSAAQQFAMKVNRFLHDHGVGREAQRAISLASYHHAQANPRAVMYGRPLDESKYDEARWIVEPFRLYDCCQENDGAAAVLLVSADRAKDFPHPPCYVLGAVSGSQHRAGAPVHNTPNYASSSFPTVAPRLYDMAQITPSDVDVLQSYENFTGGVLMSIVEFGFCAPNEVNEFFVPETFKAPNGRLPLNTSGGNLAECYMHGLELNIEAVRQVWGDSTSQVEDVNVSMVHSGPMVTPVSACVFGSEAAL